MSRKERNYVENLYEQMYPHLLRYAMASIRDRVQAEDAVQEVFIIACSKIEDVMDSPNEKGWLVNTLKYVIRDHHRMEAKCRNLVEKLISMEADKPEYTEPQILFFQHNKDVSEDLRLLQQLYIGGLTMKEIASAEGITVEACKKRVQRARKRLRNALDKK